MSNYRAARELRRPETTSTSISSSTGTTSTPRSLMHPSINYQTLSAFNEFRCNYHESPCTHNVYWYPRRASARYRHALHLTAVTDNHYAFLCFLEYETGPGSKIAITILRLQQDTRAPLSRLSICSDTIRDKILLQNRSAAPPPSMTLAAAPPFASLGSALLCSARPSVCLLTPDQRRWWAAQRSRTHARTHAGCCPQQPFNIQQSFRCPPRVCRLYRNCTGSLFDTRTFQKAERRYSSLVTVTPLTTSMHDSRWFGHLKGSHQDFSVSHLHLL